VHAQEADPAAAQTVRTRLQEVAAALMARDMNVRIDDRQGLLVPRTRPPKRQATPAGAT
jgi:hypothetical protein